MAHQKIGKLCLPFFYPLRARYILSPKLQKTFMAELAERFWGTYKIPFDSLFRMMNKMQGVLNKNAPFLIFFR